MKTIAVIAAFLAVLVACTPKFTIPDEPKYSDMAAYHMNGMVCFDPDGLNALRGNIMAQKDYAEKLRKILEGLRK